MDKRGYFKRIFNSIIGIFISLAFVAGMIYLLYQNQDTVIEHHLQYNWLVSVNGEPYREVNDLPSTIYKGLKKGDRVTIKNTLPSYCRERQTMMILGYLSAIDVHLDGQLIYSYGDRIIQDGEMVGSGYHFVNLPPRSNDMVITIRFVCGEDDAFTNLLEPVIVQTGYSHVHYANGRFYATAICMFLTVLGIVLMILSAATIRVSRIMLRLIYIGTFSFLIGLWAMCNMKILQIFEMNMAVVTTLEYLTLYLAPIPFMMLIMEMCREEKGWRYYIMRSVVLLLSTFAVVSTALHYANIVHFPKSLPYFHMFGALSLAVVVAVGIGSRRKRNNSDRMLIIGVTVLVIAIGYDLARFNIQKYLDQDNEFLSYSVIPYGALIFIIFLILSYAFYAYDMLVSKAEKDWLTYRAYTDQLCGINNRAKSTEDFAKLDASGGNIVYELINIDLNGLKHVNDSQGHEQGDVLLKEFADILKTAFEGVGEVYRMGGDEFLVIVYENNFKNVSRALETMETMEKKKSVEYPFVIEASYGIARSNEEGLDMASKVYAEADSRMYEMKMAIKRRRRLG